MCLLCMIMLLAVDDVRWLREIGYLEEDHLSDSAEWPIRRDGDQFNMLDGQTAVMVLRGGFVNVLDEYTPGFSDVLVRTLKGILYE